MEDLIIKKNSQDIIEICLEYIENSVEDVSKLFIYMSFETNPFFNVYFKNRIEIVKKNKVNEICEKKIDTSDETQSKLNQACLKKLFELKDELISNNLELPTQIKIIYSTITKNPVYEILYTEQIINKETTINIDLAEKWFAELGGELRPNSLYRMKKLFGDDFLDKK